MEQFALLPRVQLKRKNFFQNRESPETVAIKYHQIPAIPESS
jgi:hypothetical protein